MSKPTILAPMETKWFNCECSDIHHSVRVTFDPEYGDAAFEFRVNNYKKFWQRMVGAFKYLFNLGNKDCTYDAMIVRKSEAEEMIKILSKITA